MNGSLEPWQAKSRLVVSCRLNYNEGESAGDGEYHGEGIMSTSHRLLIYSTVTVQQEFGS
jgi:hypothetical protein